MVKLVNSRR